MFLIKKEREGRRKALTSHDALQKIEQFCQVYGLWAETFDSKTNTWKTDREFCLELPLKSIRLKA